MAQSRRRKKHRWLRSLVLFVVTPLTVWFLAFLIWLFWHDITRLVTPSKAPTRPGASPPRDGEPAESRGDQPAKRSREDIADEDRKKLDDILKRR